MRKAQWVMVVVDFKFKMNHVSGAIPPFSIAAKLTSPSLILPQPYHRSTAMTDTMSAGFPYTQLYSEEFVTCAGSILFRYEPARDIPFHVCILRNQDNGEYILPKGRQDLGEALSRTAIRETYEETGNMCELLPVTMITRATVPRQDMVDEPRRVVGCTEPIAVTIRKTKSGSIKLIWWYITLCTSLSSSRYSPPPPPDSKKQTQMASENFDTEWVSLEADYDTEGIETDEELDQRKVNEIKITAERVAQRLTYEKDRELLTKAIVLVGGTYPEWFLACRRVSP